MKCLQIVMDSINPCRSVQVMLAFYLVDFFINFMYHLSLPAKDPSLVLP